MLILLEGGIKGDDMDGYVGFHAALRCAYNRFIGDLAKKCKQLVRHHLDSVTCPYSQVCYFNDSYSKVLELSDTSSASHDARRDQENIPPEKNACM